MPKRATPRRRATHSARRPAAHRRDHDAQHRLARLLDSPLLDRVVPQLPAEALHQLVRHRGLDACGALLTAATPAQLTSLFDLDLWRPVHPGLDERFDDDRFGEWIEHLVDAGASLAARVVAAIDPQLVVAGLSRFVRVFDPAAVAMAAHDDASPDRQEFRADGEVGGYLLLAQRTDGWDGIMALLDALNADHPDCFHAVMQGCRRLSNSAPEVDGLDRLLTAPEQQEHDVATARQQRLSHLGYASPADARAFLEMARRSQPMRGAREFAAAPLRADAAAPRHSDDGHAGTRFGDAAAAAAVRQSLDAFAAVLSEIGTPSPPPRALLDAGATAAGRVTRLQSLMAQLADADETAFLVRSQELAFLANTLAAGCPVQSRPFTAREASDAAIGVCNLGLDHWLGRWPGSGTPFAGTASGTASMPRAFLVEHDLLSAFQAGWRVLYEDVTLYVAAALQGVLADVQCADADIQFGLHVLGRELGRECARDTPWRAGGALDVLAMLDMTVCVSLRGLLSECPVLPATVTAIVDGQTGPVSPTAFEFFSGAAQIRQVRAFMSKVRATLLD